MTSPYTIHIPAARLAAIKAKVDAYDWSMKPDEVREILKRAEEQLSGLLDSVAERALHDLLNLAERLVSDQQAWVQEVDRLRRQLEQKKKKAKTTGGATSQGQPTKRDSDYSSEKHRREREPKTRGAPRSNTPRRSFPTVGKRRCR